MSEHKTVPVELDKDAWHDAALILGESLCSVGPRGYYTMTPQQWLTWAKKQIAAAPQPAERRVKQRRIRYATNADPLRRTGLYDRRQNNVAAEQAPGKDDPGQGCRQSNAEPASAAAPSTPNKLPLTREQISEWETILYPLYANVFTLCNQAIIAIDQEQRIAELEAAMARDDENINDLAARECKERQRAEKAEAALDKSQRNVDRMLLKFSQIAPGEHVWALPNETIKWPYCMQCGIIQREDGKNSPCKGPSRIVLKAER